MSRGIGNSRTHDLDESDITRLYERYARLVDDQDFDALAAMYALDVRILLNGEHHEGVDQFISVFKDAVAAVIGSRHLITNIASDLTDGIHTYTYLLVVWWSPTQTRHGVGYYEDELGLVDGELVFVDKRIHLERVSELPAPADI